MDQEPSHWSERAAKGLPPRQPSPDEQPRSRGPGGGKPPRGARRAPSPPEGGSKGKRPNRKTLIVAICTVVVLAVAAVLIWYFMAGDAGLETADTGATPTVTSATDPTETTSPDGSGGTGPEATGPVSSTSTDSSGPATVSSIVGSTTSIPGPTGSTMSTDTKTYQDVRLALSFRYPSAWTELPLETVIELTGPPTSGFAVGDPQSATVGTTPAAFLYFGAYEDPTQTAPPARQEMEKWAAMVEPYYPLPLTVLEPMTAFKVGSIDGVSKSYTMQSQGHTLQMKVCFLSAGTCVYIFTFRAEQERWDDYKPLFDAALMSFTVVVDQ